MSKSKSSSNNLNNGKKRKSAGFIETTGFKPNWLETGPLTPEVLGESLKSEETIDAATIAAGDDQELELREEELEQSEQAPEQVIEEAAQHPPEVVETPFIDPPAQSPSEPIDEQSRVLWMEELEEQPEAWMEELEEQPEAWMEELEEQPEAWMEELEEQPEDRTDVPEEQPEVWVEELEEQLESWVQALFEDDHASRGIEPDLTMQMSELIIDQSAVVEDEDFIVGPMETTAIEATPIFEPDTVEGIAPAVVRPSEQSQAITPVRTKKRDRWTAGLLLLSLLLLGLAASIYFINPFTRLALNSATIAQPSSVSPTALPRAGSGNWCVQGDFLNGAGDPRLADGGSQGDILSGDGVFSLNHAIARPGAYSWQVVDCENQDQAYPENAAWFNTTEADQPVTFIFDATQRSNSLFPSVPYVVSAIDNTSGYRVVGSFQGWDGGDNTAQLEMINDGLYQQVRRIAAPDAYEAYFLAGDSNQSIDANGRTNNPTSLAFQTRQTGEYVVFLLDSDRGQGSVLYDMSPAFTSLAFDNGYRTISYVLAGLASLLLLFALLRLFILHNSSLRMERGCPDCGQQELMRTSRHWQQRLQNMFGIPAYRYRCRNCTWEGTRLSDIGEAVSPGALFAQTDNF